MYKDLLQFYLKATRLLKRSNFLLRIAMNLLQPELPDILASFNKHSLVLSRLVDAKTFAMVQEIKDEQVETLSMHLLHIARLEWLLRLTCAQSATPSTSTELTR